MYIYLDQLKNHLNIDKDFKGDDNYLLSLISVAETVVEKHIDCKLSYIASENGGDLPSPLVHAMLLLCGNFYRTRESIAFAQTYKVPNSYDYLLDLYKDYSCKANYTEPCKCEHNINYFGDCCENKPCYIKEEETDEPIEDGSIPEPDTNDNNIGE